MITNHIATLDIRHGTAHLTLEAARLSPSDDVELVPVVDRELT